MSDDSSIDRDGAGNYAGADSRRKSNLKRETFSTRIDPELVKKLKYLAIEEQKKLNDLLEEAILLLVEEYKRRKGKLFD